MNSVGGDAHEDDASTLQFSKEFEDKDVVALMSSEVYILLKHRHTENQLKEDFEDLSEAFIATLNYTQRFVKFNNREVIRSVRGLFASRTNLHKFEVAQIATLCPDSAEQAKSLIPSLENKMEDSELDELLQSLKNKKSLH